MTLVASAATLMLGALLGFLLRSREFRREQRLRVYAEFVGSFLAAVRAGTDLTSLHIQLGDGMLNGPVGDEIRGYVEVWRESRARFEETGIKLRMLASARVRDAASALEAYVEANLASVPPLRSGARPDDWGPEAQVGPAHVGDVALIRAREFADAASRDVTLWRER